MILSDRKDISTYLGDLYPRGSGSVRGGEVSKTEAHWEGEDSDLVVSIQHARHGLFSVRFTNVEISYAYHDVDGDARANTIYVLEYGTWSIDPDTKTLTAGRDSFMGYSSAKFSYDTLELDLPDTPPKDDGSCRVCGSFDFVLHSFGTQPLTAVGPHNFTARASASLSIRNSSPTIRCQECNTPHASSGPFNGGFVIDGKSNRREDR